MTHYYQAESYCFLTCRTRSQVKIVDTGAKKLILLTQLHKAINKFKLQDVAYAILSNHYHFLFYLKSGRMIYQITQLINGGFSFLVNRLENIERSIWDNYWASFFRGENSYWRVLGYVISNPLKHGAVKNWRELKNYQFSNILEFIKKYGEEEIKALVSQVTPFNWEEEEEFIKNMKENNTTRL